VQLAGELQDPIVNRRYRTVTLKHRINAKER
jgi:hypothetical protein